LKNSTSSHGLQIDASKDRTRKSLECPCFLGGSLATYLAQGLPAIETDWSKWRVYFCDERYVPLDHADSTYRVYKEGLMSKVPLKEEQIYKINMDVPGK